MAKSARLLVLLAACGQPAVSSQTEAVTVGPERDFIATPIDTAFGEQALRALHATATGYVAAWSDSRESIGGETAPPNTLRGYFARVAGDGTVLDPTGIPFEPPGLFANYAIASACDDAGTCLFVAPSTSTTVGAVRVTDDEVVSATSIALGSYDAFAVAWDGAAFRIAWNLADPTTMRTAQVLAGGSLGPVLDLAAGVVTGLACHGPDCLVTYRDGPGPMATSRGQTFDATTAGPTFAIFADGNHQISTPVWDGTRYWLAVIDLPDTSPFTNSPVRAYRIATDGTVLDPAGVEVVAASPAEENFAPLVAVDGVTAVVGWSRRVGATVTGRLARVTLAGVVIDLGGVTLATPESGLWALACGSGQCLTAWSTSPHYTVRGTRLTGVTELDPGGLTISTSQPGQMQARVAFGNGKYFATWQDTRRSAVDPAILPLRAAVFTPAGVENAIELHAGACPGTGGRAPVAATATAYAATWSEGCPGSANIYLELFDQSAVPLAPAQVVDAVVAVPAIASAGDALLVAWNNGGTIRASRYDATGTLLLPSNVTVSPGFDPGVAFDGASHYLVVYGRQHAVTLDPDLFVRQIALDGTVGTQRVLTAAPVPEDTASAACSGGTCVVAWLENHTQVRAGWVRPNGTIQTTASLGSGVAHSTAVAFDGVAFVVAWSTATGIRGSRLALDGTVIEDDIVLAAPPTIPARPALASDGTGKLELLYDRFDPDQAFRSRRLRVRDVDAEELTPPPDAGVPDGATGVPDAPPDAPPDAALTPDAPPDAPPDAALTPDAPPDAPAVIDAPIAPPDSGGSDGNGGGCCSAGASDDGRAVFALVAVVAIALRRRRAAPRSST